MRRVKILGKHWRLKYVPNLGDATGTCEPPEREAKTIRIKHGLSEQEELETVIHETLHAAFWPLDEEFVRLFAEDAARILWKLGYRKQ